MARRAPIDRGDEHVFRIAPHRTARSRAGKALPVVPEARKNEVRKAAGFGLAAETKCHGVGAAFQWTVVSLMAFARRGQIELKEVCFWLREFRRVRLPEVRTAFFPIAFKARVGFPQFIDG